jgi:hypothetical protein
MTVTLDESIEIYARVTVEWFGAKARERTRENIERQTRAGDPEGAEAYRRVDDCIARIERRSLSPASS